MALRMAAVSCLFVNTSVFSKTVKQTLLLWTIQEVPEPNYTFADFFSCVLRPKLPTSLQGSTNDMKLELSLVGPQKDALDQEADGTNDINNNI